MRPGAQACKTQQPCQLQDTCQCIQAHATVGPCTTDVQTLDGSCVSFTSPSPCVVHLLSSSNAMAMARSVVPRRLQPLRLVSRSCKHAKSGPLPTTTTNCVPPPTPCRTVATSQVCSHRPPSAHKLAPGARIHRGCHSYARSHAGHPRQQPSQHGATVESHQAAKANGIYHRQRCSRQQAARGT